MFYKDNPKKFRGGFCKVFYRGYTHPRMWAQYASNHTGVCLVFDKELIKISINHDFRNMGQLFEDSIVYKD